MTNADKIRSMSNEELAFIIMCPYGTTGSECKDTERGLKCLDCCRDWLGAESVDTLQRFKGKFK